MVSSSPSSYCCCWLLLVVAVVVVGARSRAGGCWCRRCLVFACVQVCMALHGAGVADGFGRRVQNSSVAVWPPSKSDVDIYLESPISMSAIFTRFSFSLSVSLSLSLYISTSLYLSLSLYISLFSPISRSLTLGICPKVLDRAWANQLTRHGKKQGAGGTT